MPGNEYESVQRDEHHFAGLPAAKEAAEALRRTDGDEVVGMMQESVDEVHFAGLQEAEEAAEAFRRTDRHEVVKMMQESIWLIRFCGLGNFGFAPLGYLCGRLGWPLGLWLLVVLQMAWGFAVQQRIVQKVGPLASLSQAAVVWDHKQWRIKATFEYKDPHQKLLRNYTISSLGVTLCFQTWILVAGQSLAEYFDPTTDANTAGMAHSTLTAATRKEFAESWQGVLWKWGDLIAYMNLEGVLVFLVAVTWVVQVFVFISNMSSASSCVRRYQSHTPTLAMMRGEDIQDNVENMFECHGVHNLQMFWSSISSAAEAASVGVVGQLVPVIPPTEAQSFSGTFRDLFYGLTPWFYKLLVKVFLEALPSSWFTVSLLALTIEDVDGTQAITMAGSVVMSLCTMVLALLHPVLTTMGGYEATHCQKICMVLIIFFVCFPITFPLVIVSARFVGLFACPSHQWALTSWGCVT